MPTVDDENHNTINPNYFPQDGNKIVLSLKVHGVFTNNAGLQNVGGKLPHPAARTFHEPKGHQYPS